jgi:hypothetical protein
VASCAGGFYHADADELIKWRMMTHQSGATEGAPPALALRNR